MKASQARRNLFGKDTEEAPLRGPIQGFLANPRVVTLTATQVIWNSWRVHL